MEPNDKQNDGVGDREGRDEGENNNSQFKGDGGELDGLDLDSYTLGMDLEDKAQNEQGGLEGVEANVQLQREEVQTADEAYDTGDGEGEEEEEGFGDGDDLPIFANAQSRELQAETKKSEARLEEVELELAENTERLKIMEEHLKNVQLEVQHSDALMDAKRKETATEVHMTALAEREAGRYHQETLRFVKEEEEATEKVNNMQNGIFAANEHMDRFKLQMNWNQEELEQWALAAKQKEEDSLALQKYTRADETKIKELTLQLERLSKEVVAKQAQMDNVEAETNIKQVELDRAAEEFRVLHKERQDLVHKWQEAVDAIRRNDAEISKTGQKYAEARKLRQQRHEVLQQNAERLKMQADDNAEVQGKIEYLERMVAKRRLDQMQAQNDLQEFKDELDVLKNTLSSAALALSRKQAHASMLAEQVEKKKDGLELARKKYKAAKRRVEAEAEQTLSAEASARAAEDALKAKDAGLKATSKQLSAAKAQMFKETQKLYVFRGEEATHIAEISGTQASLSNSQHRNLRSKIHQLDQDQMRQQELVYSAEFQIQQMERKLARGLGERTDEEKQVLQAKVAELEGVVGEARSEKRMLVGQLRNLNNELHAALRQKETALKQQASLDEVINELELECGVAESSLRKTQAKSEQGMVQNDVLRLEVKRLRDVLNSRTGEVFSLENRKQQLRMSMEERKSEISVHCDIQHADLKMAEEERHNVCLELGQRKQNVEKLRAKYETLAKGFGGGGGGGDKGGNSQAYFVIQAAQKREELQREGDGLDQKIRTCEREIKALEHTLQHLHARNVDFRMSFQKADAAGSDADLLRQLTNKTKLSADSLFRQKKELQRLQTDLEEDSARYESVRKQVDNLSDENMHLRAALDQVDRDVEATGASVERSTKRLSKLRQEHRNEMGGGHQTLTEKRFRAEVLRETSANVLYTLGQLAKEFPEMQDALNVQLAKAKLVVPTKPPSFTSRPLSARTEGTDANSISDVSETSAVAPLH
ncbi:unnamed protein product [Chrysoparadoxa australica]